MQYSFYAVYNGGIQPDICFKAAVQHRCTLAAIYKVQLVKYSAILQKQSFRCYISPNCSGWNCSWSQLSVRIEKISVICTLGKRGIVFRSHRFRQRDLRRRRNGGGNQDQHWKRRGCIQSKIYPATIKRIREELTNLLLKGQKRFRTLVRRRSCSLRIR